MSDACGEYHRCLYSRAGEPFDDAGIGLSGCWGHWKSGGSVSSYEDPPNWFHQLANGAYFIDASKSDQEAFTRLVVRGPLVDHGTTELATDDENPWRFTEVEETKAGSLSYITHQEYLGRVSRIPGVRIGYRRGNEMVWRVGKPGDLFEVTTQTIEPCRCWIRVCFGCDKMRYYVDRDVDRAQREWPLSPTARVPSGPDDHCPACKGKEQEASAAS